MDVEAERHDIDGLVEALLEDAGAGQPATATAATAMASTTKRRTAACMRQSTHEGENLTDAATVHHPR